MNLELYKNLGNCLSEAEILWLWVFFFCFFPSSQKQASSRSSGSSKGLEYKLPRPLAAVCFWCFVYFVSFGGCVCFWMHSSSFLFFFCCWETQEQRLDLTSPLAIPNSSSFDRGPAGEFYQLAFHWVWTQDLFCFLEVPKWAIPVTHHWCVNLILLIFASLIIKLPTCSKLQSSTCQRCRSLGGKV